MGRKITRYGVLTPFEQVEVVAGICKLGGYEGVTVIPTPVGAAVLREVRVQQYDEWDVRTITGPDAAEVARLEKAGSVDSGPAVAAHFSRLSRYGVVLLETTLSDTTGFEQGVSGEVKARRYLDGVPGEEISAGMLLQTQAGDSIARFFLGEVSASELEGAVSTEDITSNDILRLARKATSGRRRRTPEDGAGRAGRRGEATPAQDEAESEDTEDFLPGQPADVDDWGEE